MLLCKSSLMSNVINVNEMELINNKEKSKINVAWMYTCSPMAVLCNSYIPNIFVTKYHIV